MTHTFTFGQVEAMLANSLGIASHKRTAFAGRLKNFIRIGFLKESQRRGRATIYDLEDCFKFALAAEFTAIGIMPEMAVRAVVVTWPDVRDQLVKLSKRDDFPTCYAAFGIEALYSLRDDSTRFASVAFGADLAQLDSTRTSLLLNLTGFRSTVMWKLAQISKMHPREFHDAVASWSASVGTHPEGRDSEAGLVRSMGDAVTAQPADAHPSVTGAAQ